MNKHKVSDQKRALLGTSVSQRILSAMQVRLVSVQCYSSFKLKGLDTNPGQVVTRHKAVTCLTHIKLSNLYKKINKV